MCKTWAPRGHTPRISHHYRHDRISVISGVSLSAVRHRVGLYFRWHRKNIQRPEVVAFVRHLLRHLPGEVIILWDNNNIHKGEPLDRLRRRCPRLHIEFFPAYAPELNPDEGVWAQAKHRLANGRPDDLAALSRRLTATLRRLHRSPHRLRRCLHQTGLPFFQ